MALIEIACAVGWLLALLAAAYLWLVCAELRRCAEQKRYWIERECDAAGTIERLQEELKVAHQCRRIYQQNYDAIRKRMLALKEQQHTRALRLP